MSRDLGVGAFVQYRLWLNWGRLGDFSTDTHAHAIEVATAAALATGRRHEVRRQRGWIALFFPRWIVREVAKPRTSSANMALPDRGSNT